MVEVDGSSSIFSRKVQDPVEKSLQVHRKITVGPQKNSTPFFAGETAEVLSDPQQFQQLKVQVEQ
ncbi:MAG: hypothetical protein GY822_25940 [Deltaproteobacteria bacterium]|nr:hypothetical protein [Deltaproteobacteria bacterium]